MRGDNNLGKSQPTVDIGILTIREDEFQAILKAFPREIDVHIARREYSIREADAADGKKYVVAVLRQFEQGNGEAQDAARDLIDDFDPSLLLVVGIAGGVPSSDLTLGDVVVSTRVNDYCVEAKKHREDTSYSLSGGPIAKKIASGVANLTGRKEFRGWTKNLKKKPSVKWKSQGSLYGNRKWQDDVAKSLELHFGRKARPRAPIFVAGPIASSDRLIKDAKIVIPWLQTARHLLAIEMESGGVFRAARDRCPMLAIRGISDIVGLRRDEAWTKYACTSAAAFTRAYLRTQPVAPKIQADKLGEGPLSDLDFVEDSLFLNLVQVTKLPATIFVTPSEVPTPKHAWGKLLEKKDEPIPNAWCLQSKNVYSFFDPKGTPIEKIVDMSAVEEHATEDFVQSKDPERRHILSQLLRRALEDDLAKIGVRYNRRDNVFSFLGRPDEPPRTFRYQNVHLESEITVVSHYETESKTDGKKYKVLRHTAFSGRFLEISGTWYLEFTPTYRFTFDGKNRDKFHEQRLKGIKRLEKNRSVLSQVLLWTDLFCTLGARIKASTNITFEKLPPFSIDVTTARSGKGVMPEQSAPRAPRPEGEMDL